MVCVVHYHQGACILRNYVKGGALDVGKASTNAVVASSILILLFDVILTKLLMQ